MTSPRTLGIPSPTRKDGTSPRSVSFNSSRPLSHQSVTAAGGDGDKDGDDDEIHGPHISALTEQTSLTDTFVGLILLPIPNCDFAPISLAVDDQLEQIMKYTVGRSIQTALLVEPAVVLLAWGLRIPDVTLAFDGFEVVSLFTTILLLNFLVVDAKVHWVHGILLLADWVLIGIAAYFVHPQID
ncbi:hypothetical protein SLS64_011256 [Diaporthe eres]